LSLSEYHNAKKISVYLSMPHGEISTTGIVRDALARGKEVFIPYIHTVEAESAQAKVSVMDMLSLNSMEEFESLMPDKWGIPSLSETSVSTKKNCFGGYGVAPRPRNAEEISGLDLIVVPGMAFDFNLRRLGHGKGYYDRFLNRYSREVAGSTGAPGKPFLGTGFCPLIFQQAFLTGALPL
jgi:5-formyltetrahydrofolate cyclo-ligase